MTSHHQFSPSKLGTMTQGRCQGRAREEEKYPALDLGEGAEGTAAHEHFARALVFLSDHGVSQIAGVEAPLTVRDGEKVLTTGTADLVLLRGDLVEVIDWKFSHELLDETTARIQITAYCVGAMQTLGKTRATGWLFLPRLDLQYKADVELEAGLAEIKRIVEGASAPDAPLVAGPWCRWCAARYACPAVQAAGLEVKAALPIESPNGVAKTVLRERYDGQIAAMIEQGELDHLAQLSDQAYVLKPATDALRAAVKDLIKRGYGEHFPRWKITEKESRLKANMLAVYRRVSDVLTDAEFAECADIKWGKLEEHWLGRKKLEAESRGEKFVKAQALRELEALLGDVVVKGSYEELRRNK